MPGLSYAQIGPPGIAAALLFLAGGWLLDQLTAPPRPAAPRPVGADPADRIGLVRLILHVAALGPAVFAIGALAGLDFQHALLLAVPFYSLGWAARLGMCEPSGPSAAVARVTALTIRRFPLAAPEIAILASAGLLSVLALEMIPTDRVQALVAGASAGGWQVILALFVLATVGINPIITAAVLGALVTRLDIPA